VPCLVSHDAPLLHLSVGEHCAHRWLLPRVRFFARGPTLPAVGVGGARRGALGHAGAAHARVGGLAIFDVAGGAADAFVRGGVADFVVWITRRAVRVGVARDRRMPFASAAQATPLGTQSPYLVQYCPCLHDPGRSRLARDASVLGLQARRLAVRTILAIAIDVAIVEEADRLAGAPVLAAAVDGNRVEARSVVAAPARRDRANQDRREEKDREGTLLERHPMRVARNLRVGQSPERIIRETGGPPRSTSRFGSRPTRDRTTPRIAS